MTLRGTTSPGIEDVAVGEGCRLLADAGFEVTTSSARAYGLAGVVSWELADAGPDDVRRADPLRGARSLYHVAVHTCELEWDGRSLESLLRAIRGVPCDAMTTARSFRVSCNRAGEHGFQSPEVEREVGAILQDRYGTPVDLEHYDLHVKVDVVGERAFCGYQLTGRKGLDRRYPWIYHPRVTLRTPIAYAMLELAGFVDAPGRLHDPFCGSGTIVLEAASVVRERSGSAGRGSPVSISGSDWDPKAVGGARANIEAAGLGEIDVYEHDAFEIASALPEAGIRYLVTNPPFGIRIARGTNFLSFYRRLLEGAATVLEPGGVLALLVGKRRAVFNRVLRGFPEFELEGVRVIEMGGVFPALFLLRRTSVEYPIDGSAARER